jgi:hypothetical protein
VNIAVKLVLILVGAILLRPGACAVVMLPSLSTAVYHGNVGELVTWLVMACLGALGVWPLYAATRA